MRIVVPGPTSRTGLLPLARAQRRGHQIVVFTRRPEARPDSPALAAVVRGDGRDAGTLAETLAGAAPSPPAPPPSSSVWPSITRPPGSP